MRIRTSLRSSLILVLLLLLGGGVAAYGAFGNFGQNRHNQTRCAEGATRQGVDTSLGMAICKNGEWVTMPRGSAPKPTARATTKPKPKVTVSPKLNRTEFVGDS